MTTCSTRLAVGVRAALAPLLSRNVRCALFAGARLRAMRYRYANQEHRSHAGSCVSLIEPAACLLLGILAVLLILRLG